MKLVPSFERLTRLCAADKGVSALEFAFIAPILAVLVMGVIDLGVGLWSQMQVANAAAAGAEYAFIHGWNSSAIASAVTQATEFSAITAAPAPAEFCGCANVTSGVAQTGGALPCSGRCPDGTLVGTYVLVSAQAPYSLILPFPGIADSMSLTSSAVARVK